MNNLTYLFAAFAVIWAGTLAFLLRLAVLRKQLEARIERLESLTAFVENEDG